MDTVHRDGTIWNIAMMILLLMFPVAVCIVFQAMPDWRGVIEGLIATAPMYWAVGVVEVTSPTLSSLALSTRLKMQRLMPRARRVRSYPPSQSRFPLS